jgi:hypothetical protein
MGLADKLAANLAKVEEGLAEKVGDIKAAEEALKELNAEGQDLASEALTKAAEVVNTVKTDVVAAAPAVEGAVVQTAEEAVVAKLQPALEGMNIAESMLAKITEAAARATYEPKPGSYKNISLFSFTTPSNAVKHVPNKYGYYEPESEEETKELDYFATMGIVEKV